MNFVVAFCFILFKTDVSNTNFCNSLIPLDIIYLKTAQYLIIGSLLILYWLVLVFSAGFMKLLDNYVMATGTAERITPEEVTENNQFLDAILETEVMKVRPGISLPKPQTNLSLGAHCFSQCFLEIKCFCHYPSLS